MSQYRAKMVVTPTQANYLHDLLQDDIEQSDLSQTERDAAKVLLSRVEGVQVKYQERRAL